MESMKMKRKGLTSILVLILCIAMLAGGTFAWFTDTATVKGNKVYAGTLTVDVVATVQEVLNAFAQDLYGQDYFDGEDTIDIAAGTGVGKSGDATKTGKEVVEAKFDEQNLVLCAIDPAITGDTEVAEAKENLNKVIKSVSGGVTLSEDYYGYYVILTDKEVPIINVSNVEPGATYPVQMHVMNSGELAISYAAGFAIVDKTDEAGNVIDKASKTGLEALEAQKSALGDKYDYLKGKLVAKQVAIDPTTGKQYPYATTGTNKVPGVAGKDLGGHLEDILEVYSMTKAEYNKTLTDGVEAAMTLDTNKTDLDGNYIGTIAQIIHCNDTAYIQDLNAKVAAAEQAKTDAQTEKTAKEEAYAAINAPVAPDATAPTPDQIQAALEARDAARAAYTDALDVYNKLYAEQQELPKVAKRLAKAASGYCIPENYSGTVTSEGKVQIYEPDGSARVNGLVDVSNIGTSYFAIHMPGEEANDLYQNAMLTLNAGITANQVELDRDGIHVMVYDDAEERGVN